MNNKRLDLLLPAIAYGDAAGLPTEAKSAQWIRDHYGRIDQLVPPDHNGIFKGEWPAGTTSDDTQLSRVVARSLVNCRRFSLDDQAAGHIDAYQENVVGRAEGRTVVRGWGRSTTEAIERVMQGVDPHVAGQPDGAGNGIIMKQAPLAVWHGGQQTPRDRRYWHYDELTTMTHDSDIARACTRIHGEVLLGLLRDEPFEVTIVRQLASYSQAFSSEMSLLARAVTEPCRNDAELEARYAEGKSGFKYGFYAPETLAIAYDIYAGSDDFATAVYRAVNLGGDSDSVASTVAAMMTLAGKVTSDTVPADVRETDDYFRNRSLSKQLARAAFTGAVIRR